MKLKMKKVGCFLLSGMILMGISVKSDNLYVYLTNNSKQPFSVNETLKLTFDASSMTVHDAVPQTMPYANWKFFSLKDFLSTGIDDGKAATLKVYPNPVANVIHVTNTTDITSLNLYDPQGRKLVSLAPAASVANIPVSGLPSGIYVLQIADEKGITIQKIIKK